MTERKSIVIAGVLLWALLPGTVTLAMGSDNYRLDWFTPLTGSGGGAASSDHYAINFTVGQTVIGKSDSSNYEGCLGYCCGGAAEYRIFLPLVLRSVS
ncbi:MAG: hypothetical protein PVG71_12060 [Anaerolineae bacterium]|jgi:hypothetical protein